MGSACSSRTALGLTPTDAQTSSPRNASRRSVSSDKSSRTLPVPSTSHVTETHAETITSDDIIIPVSDGPQKPIPEDPKLPHLSDLPHDVTMMLSGRIENSIPQQDRIIYIYHLSNFTDAIPEKSYLMKYVYPDLRDFCVKNGRELVVIDLHMDLKDEMSHGHRLRTVGQYVMSDLVSNSKNAFLTIFLNHNQAGYCCPIEIKEQEFNQIISRAQDDDKAFLNQWYTKTTCSHQPCFVLCPPESCLPRSSRRSGQSDKDLHGHFVHLHNLFQALTGPDFQSRHFHAAMEDHLDEFVFSGKWPKERIFWLKCSSNEVNTPHTVNGLGTTTNSTFAKKLESISSKLRNHVYTKKMLDFSVDSYVKSLDNDTQEENPQLTDVAIRYKELLNHALSDLQQNRHLVGTGFKTAVHKDVSKELFTTIVEHSNFCKKLSEYHTGSEGLLKELHDYLVNGYLASDETEDAIVHPLVLHGRPGAGMSSLAAKLASTSSSVEGWTRSLCVMRFVGCSTFCTSEEQLVFSIKEQLFLLAGISPVSMQDKDLTIATLLGKISPNTQVLVIVDGMDHLSPSGTQISWLPRSLPHSVRIVVTTSTEGSCFTTLQKYLPTEANFVEIPPLNIDEALVVLKYHASQQGVNPNTKSTEQKLRSLEHFKGLTHLTVRLLSILFIEGSMSADFSVDFGLDEADLIRGLLEDLEDRFNMECLRRLLAYITCSRCGLSDSEIQDIIQVDVTMKQEMSPDPNPNGTVPCYLWYSIKHILQPVLLQRVSHGFPVHSWKHKNLQTIISQKYASHLTSCESLLLTFFDEGFAVSEPRKNMNKSSNLVSNVKVPKSIQFERRLEEIPWLLTNQNKVKNLCKSVLFNWKWMQAKLKASGLLQWKKDLQLGLTMVAPESSKWKSLSFLIDLVDRLEFLSSRQFISQIPFRVRAGDIVLKDSLPEIKDFLDYCKKTTGPILQHGMDEITLLRMTFPNTPPELKRTIHGIFRVHKDDQHVITVSSEEGTLKVWNIYSGKTVRTITGLRTPKDVKMCDDRRAVVLCDRELNIYNLYDGTFVCALKGVLNIKMPYFGIHNDVHTVAIARNRMYINMMNNQTGETVTTFKVGEDRFLDSLLISDNGSRCVCGDAVQKPFPLLVWDLDKRKLIHDLRIKGHEFLTSISDISNDGQYMVCACKQLEDPVPAFLVVYDLHSGAMFRKWKNEYSVISVAISLTEGVVVAGHVDGMICVWNITSGDLKHEMLGHSHGPDTIRLSDSGSRCVSFDSSRRDTSVRMWDVSKGVCLGCFYSGYGVSCCDISPDGSMVLVGIHGVDNVLTLLPPDENISKKNVHVFGDAKHEGQVFDMSNANS